MNGLEYEYVVAQYLKKHGYTNVKVTKGSGDYGVDVVASKGKRKYAVQCKLYSSPVGLSAVQEAVAGMAMYGCNSAMVVTNSTFTSAARNLANANSVVLLEQVSPAGKKPHGKAWAFVKKFYIGLLVFVNIMLAIFLKKHDVNTWSISQVIASEILILIPEFIYLLLIGIKNLILWIYAKATHAIQNRNEREEFDLLDEERTAKTSSVEIALDEVKTYSAPNLFVSSLMWFVTGIFMGQSQILCKVHTGCE